ncbi:hypothetical protein F4825DRAFT_69396 [Nemania diffusa]|nr:hypothetical protein F4825DRAFT_69396 [Nemania diffusa]
MMNKMPSEWSRSGFAPVAQVDDTEDQDSDGRDQHKLSGRERFRKTVHQVLRQTPSAAPHNERLLSAQSSPALSDSTLTDRDYLSLPIQRFEEVDLSDARGRYAEYMGSYGPEVVYDGAFTSKVGKGLEVRVESYPLALSPGGLYVDDRFQDSSYRGSGGIIEDSSTMSPTLDDYKPVPLRWRFILLVFGGLVTFLALSVLALRLLPDASDVVDTVPVFQNTSEIRKRSGPHGGGGGHGVHFGNSTEGISTTETISTTEASITTKSSTTTEVEGRPTSSTTTTTTTTAMTTSAADTTSTTTDTTSTTTDTTSTTVDTTSSTTQTQDTLSSTTMTTATTATTQSQHTEVTSTDSGSGETTTSDPTQTDKPTSTKTEDWHHTSTGQTGDNPGPGGPGTGDNPTSDVSRTSTETVSTSTTETPLTSTAETISTSTTSSIETQHISSTTTVSTSSTQIIVPGDGDPGNGLTPSPAQDTTTSQKTTTLSQETSTDRPSIPVPVLGTSPTAGVTSSSTKSDLLGVAPITPPASPKPSPTSSDDGSDDRPSTQDSDDKTSTHDSSEPAGVTASDSSDRSKDGPGNQSTDKKIDPGHNDIETTSSTTLNIPSVTTTTQTSPATNMMKVTGDTKIHTSTNTAAQADSPPTTMLQADNPSTTTQLPDRPEPPVEADPTPFTTFTSELFEELFLYFLLIS